MSRDPTKRHASAEDFGRELQLAQRHNGLMADSMVLSETNGEPGQTSATTAMRFATMGETDLSEPSSIALGGSPEPTRPKPFSNLPGSTGPISTGPISPGPISPIPPRPSPPIPPRPSPPTPPPPTPPGGQGRIPDSDGPTSITRKPRNRRPLLFAAAAAVVALVLVVSGIYFISSRDKGNGGSTGSTGSAGSAGSASQPTTEPQAGWKPITNARVAREAAATTQADGTIWI